MAKKVKFPLKMADEAQVRTLDELKEHFDLASVLGYYANGKLVEWLSDRYYEDEAEKIKELDATAEDFKKQLCEILNVEYSEDAGEKVDLADITDRNNRKEKLKKYTADDKILAEVDSVAFTQEELADLLDSGKKVIYLCGDKFEIPGSKEGIKYIGVNNPKVDTPDGFIEKGITFEGVDIGLDAIIKQAKEAPEDSDAHLWKMAAELGDAEAQYTIGLRYYCGAGGVEKNYEEAVKWYRKAAEQGYADAQCVIACCYVDGVVVQEDYKEADLWFQKATDQGYEIPKEYVDKKNSKRGFYRCFGSSIFFERNGWLYFVNNGKITKEEISTGYTITIEINKPSGCDLLLFISIDNGWLYYAIEDSDNKYIYRCKTNGAEQHKVLVNYPDLYNIFDDLVFYNNKVYYWNSDNNVLYRMEIDGSNQEEIYSTKEEFEFYIIDNNIYFCEYDNDIDY